MEPPDPALVGIWEPLHKKLLEFMRKLHKHLSLGGKNIIKLLLKKCDF